ncbi:MAG: hypothetical protein WC829_21840, partial [Hyphomicrobium sp.]
MSEAQNITGLVVVDKAGKIVFSVGRGTDARIVSLVEDKTWRTDAIQRRIVPVQTETNSVLLWSQVKDLHFATIVDGITDSVFEFTAAIDFAWDIIHHLLTDPFNAMTVVDSEAKVAFLSPIHEGFFG